MTVVNSAIICVQKIERHLLYIKFVKVDNYGYLPVGRGEGYNKYFICIKTKFKWYG